ncbi:hypothetical protein ACLOJK_019152 [Asimina triloba]
MVIRVKKIVKEERKNDRMFEFRHEYDGLILMKREDTNIRPGYIGHQHLIDGLMPDVQVKKKTLILSGTWRGCNGSFIGLTPPDQRVPSHFLLCGWRFMGRTGCPSRLAGKKLEEDASDEEHE